MDPGSKCRGSQWGPDPAVLGEIDEISPQPEAAEQPEAGMQSMLWHRSCSGSPLPSQPAARWQIPPTQSPAAASSAGAALPRRGFLPVWAGGLAPSCSSQKGRGLVPDGHPQISPPVLFRGCWHRASRPGPGGCCTQPGWEKGGGGFRGWAGRREGKGGCKLGEKVRHAINKWHPGKKMSACSGSDTQQGPRWRGCGGCGPSRVIVGTGTGVKGSWVSGHKGTFPLLTSQGWDQAAPAARGDGEEEAGEDEGANRDR